MQQSTPVKVFTRIRLIYNISGNIARDVFHETMDSALFYDIKTKRTNIVLY